LTDMAHTSGTHQEIKRRGNAKLPLHFSAPNQENDIVVCG